MEREVNEQHQRVCDYRSIVDNSHVIIVSADLEGRFTFVNQAFLSDTGYRADEYLGKPFADFIHPDDRERVMHLFQEAFISPKGHVELEARIISKQGITKHMFASIDSVRENDKIVGFNAVLTDITELKRTEEALRNSEEEFRNLVENAPVGIGITTLNGFPVLRNKAMVELYQYNSKDELMQEHTIARYYDPKDRERFIAEAKRGTVRDFEVKLKRRDGTEFWGSLTAISQMTEHGEGYFTILQDISGRKKVEEALKASEERYRSLFDTMHEGVAVHEIIYDKSGKPVDYVITDVNPAFEFITGLKREDAIGMRGAELHGTLEPPFLDIYSHVADSGEAASFETPYPSTVKYFNVSVSSRRKGTFATILFDITDSKQANEEVLVYQKELQSLAYQLSLAEERSRRAIATDVHDRVGQALALCRIKLGALADTFRQSSPLFTERLAEIQTLVKELIGEVRTLTFELSSPLLYEVGLEAAIEQLTEQIRENYGVDCSFEDDGLPKQLSDDLKIVLFQAVRELLFNVTKHARAHKAKVNIKKFRKEIRITVKDDGVGFDTSLIDAYHHRVKGFGLLSVRERLRYVGGRFEIESQVGHGTQAILIAPLQG